MNEEGVEETHFIPYDRNYVIAYNDEHPPSDAIWYPCPFFNPISSQEGFLDGLTSPSCGTDEADFASSLWNENELAEETYEGEELPYYGCGNWLREYESSFGQCWGDGYFYHGNGTHNNEGDSELKEIEGPRQSEQQHESHLRHEEVTQYGHPSCDSNPWYDLWLAFGGETETYGWGEQETRITPSYNVPDIGVCESLFGYWPCLYR
ncbi:unnamed protein product [Prunus armeniaca]|uniref:Uncharacterized protein n=1 Tax=Prunus armeniaca TaxID=36596 RepID=A0A6J5XUY1_PRUAR|nr:hypothetical protein GBA52_019513 [Prunus armeniaca]CAB4284412.1 unnamed protein product [Prunus armeniaca]CAB4314824.1 unnamed protein product [Prunus armeniaca]